MIIEDINDTIKLIIYGGVDVFDDINNDKLKDTFYSVIKDTDEVTKTILLSLYKSIKNFFILSEKNSNKGKLVELLKKYEKEAYTINGKSLTDKQIIKYELQRIEKEYQKQINLISSSDLVLDGNSKIQHYLLVLVEYYMDQIKKFKDVRSLTSEDIKFLKQKIAYIEVLLKMTNGLYYENFLCFVDELEMLERRNKKQKHETRRR